MNDTPHNLRSRSYSWADPKVDMAALMAMSGLDQLRSRMTGGARPPIADTLDFNLVELEYGRVLFAGTPGEYLYNPIGTVHGGYAATLLDSALGCSVHTTLKPGFAYTTVELKVNYVRALRADTGLIHCEGKIIHVGGRIATAEARITSPDGTKLFAHGTTTCLIFPANEGKGA
jgi:uncharacterized protein (TIGR00369 family)